MVIVYVLVLVALLLWWRSARVVSRSPLPDGRAAVPSTTDRAPRTPLVLTPVHPQSPAPSTVTDVVATSPAPESFQFWVLRMSAEGVVVESRKRVDGAFKPGALLERPRGIYFRCLDADGRVVGEGVENDPSIVYYDRPAADGSGRLEGGVVRLNEATLALRFPSLPGPGRVELYRVDGTKTVSEIIKDMQAPYATFNVE